MTHFEYITDHLLRAWLQQWNCNYRIWADLITGNYERYALFKEDNPYQECYDWFWACINLDDTLSKEYLETLYQMMDDIDTGIVKTVPAKDFLQRMKNIVDAEEKKHDLSH